MESKIAEKIQKLLAMAEHPKSNENEAALALERAQELLLRHNLTRADVINDNGTGVPSGIGQLSHKEAEGYAWKRDLAAILATANLCRVIGQPSCKSWSIFGAYDNVRSVMEMYNWITLQLSFMANREYRDYKNDEGTERGQTWKAGFYNGALSAIRDRLTKPMDDFKYGTGKDLVVVNDEALKIAVHKIFPHLQSRRASNGGGNDGRSNGRRYAQSMALAPQRQLGGTLRLGTGS